jgi:hypothetical protein
LGAAGSGRAYLRVQRERRQDRPLGVILLRHRRAKQRDEALTAKFDQAPGIALQHLLDDGEHRLHAPMHRLRPQTHGQSQCISQTATEHGHLFVFSSERERVELLRKAMESF